MREAAVELVQTGATWATWSISYAMWSLGAGTEGQGSAKENPVQRSDDLFEARNAHVAATSRFALSVSDDGPTKSFEAIRAKMNAAITATSRVYGAIATSQVVSSDAMSEMFQLFDRYRKDLEAFETELRPFVAETLVIPPTRSKTR